MKVSLSKQASSVLEIILLSHLGRIVADKWLMKSQLAAKGTQDLLTLIMPKKLTFRGLPAWVVITPPAMLKGSYILFAQKLDRLLGRTCLIVITG